MHMQDNHAFSSSPLSCNDFSHWPFLSSLCDLHLLSYIDIAFADHFFYEKKKRILHSEETIAAFLCYLIASARQGHNRVYIGSIEKLAIHPHPARWLPSSEEKSKEQIDRFIALIHEGSRSLPEKWITLQTLPADNSEENLTLNRSTTPLIRLPSKEGSFFYLQRYWEEEIIILCNLQRICAQTLNPPEESFKEEISHLSDTLTEEQKKALSAMYIQPCTIVTGGPGTGKSYVAGRFIQYFLKKQKGEKNPTPPIILTAPTGKAIAHLQKSIRQQMHSSSLFCSMDLSQIIRAETVHRLLSSLRGSWIAAEVILVDEASLLDSRWLGKLLSAVAPHTRLIFLGDPYQLPSVETGAFFSDFFSREIYQKIVPSPISLTHSLRTDRAELLQLFDSIQKGEEEAVWEQLEQGGETIQKISFSTERGKKEEWIQFILKHLPSPLTLEALSFSEALAICQKFCFLSPRKSGPWGADELQKCLIQYLLYPLKETSKVAFPLMVTKNDYTLGVFNGEIGLLRCHYDPQKTLSTNLDTATALFSLHKEGELYSCMKEEKREIPLSLLPSYSYAYGFSIHKSQGSEFDHVCLILPEEEKSSSREGFYTAATRARHQLTLFCSKKSIQMAMKNTLPHSEISWSD